MRAFWILTLFCLPWPIAARAETLTLADCLRETAEKNPQIVQQRALLEQALGARLTFRARALPRLGVSINVGQQGDQGTTLVRAGGTTTDANGNKVPIVAQTLKRGSKFYALGAGELAQPLFDAAIPASLRRSNLEVVVARQNLAAVASAQLYLARLRFYDAVFQRDFAALQRSIAEQLDKNVRTAGDLAKAGLAGQQLALQAQVQRANLGPGVLASEGNYQQALTTLLGLMGRDLGPGGAAARGKDGGGNGGDRLDQIALRGSLDEAEPPAFDPAKAAAEALARRPDILAQRETLNRLAEDARIIRAGYYPQVVIYLAGQAVPETFTRSSNSARPGDDVRTTELRYGARYNWNVIDTGSVQGAARQQDALRAGVAANVQKLEQSVGRDLAKLRAQISAAEAQIAIARGNAATAQETLNIVSGGVAQGINSQLDFLDAQNGLLNTRSDLLLAQLQIAQAGAEFDRITGGYLRFVSEPDSAPPISPTSKKRP